MTARTRSKPVTATIAGSLKAARFRAVLTMFVISGCALSDRAGAITLNEFVGEVVQTHPNVLQQVHQYRQLVQETRIARKGWHPRLDVNASSGAYSTESPITNQQRREYNSSLAAVTLTQNLFSGFDTTHQIDQTEARLQSAAYRLYDEADNIALGAIKAYLEAVKQKRLLALAKKNVESHERTFLQIKARTEAGAGRRSEVEQVDGRLARALAGYAAQQNNFHDALTQLHKFLGRYVTAEELADPAPPQILNGDLEPTIDNALREHPGIRSAALNVEAARAEYERSKSTHYPKIDLQLRAASGDNLSGYDGRTREGSATLNLTFNLYNGGADQAEQRKRASSVFEHNEFANRVRREVIETLRLAWMANTALAEQQGHFERQAERMARTVQSYREEFFLGRRDLLDLLDAESEHNEAEKSLQRTIYDSVAARYRLWESVGNLFGVLGLDVTVSDEGVRALRAERSSRDILPTAADRDRDEKTDRDDHCDNSRPGTPVDRHGCAEQLGWPIMGSSTPTEQVGTRVEADGVPVIADLHFVFDTTELTSESENRLTGIVAQLARMPLVTIEIFAHTDGKGTPAYNNDLSQRRAQMIRDRLVRAGFDPSRVKAYGRGNQEPIADNDSEEGRALNRRVVLRVAHVPN